MTTPNPSGLIPPDMRPYDLERVLRVIAAINRSSVSSGIVWRPSAAPNDTRFVRTWAEVMESIADLRIQGHGLRARVAGEIDGR